MYKQDLQKRCLELAVKVVKMSNDLPRNSAGFEIGKQVVRSSASVGANSTEAGSARTRKEFISCMYIALKEVDETQWWLKVIEESNLLDKDELNDLKNESKQLAKIITTIIKNTKHNARLTIRN